MSDQYLGEIRMFAGNYAPEGWVLCDGRSLPIAGNEALYSILGTTYGGDGQTKFSVPDLRGRIPLSQGPLVGGATYVITQSGGAEAVAVTEAQMPAHTHQALSNGLSGELNTPANAYWASGFPYSNQAPNASMDAGIVSQVGGNQLHSNLMPFLVINFIIAVQGNYPQQQG